MPVVCVGIDRWIQQFRYQVRIAEEAMLAANMLATYQLAVRICWTRLPSNLHR